MFYGLKELMKSFLRKNPYIEKLNIHLRNLFEGRLAQSVEHATLDLGVVS